MPRGQTPLRASAAAIPVRVFAWFMEESPRPLEVYVRGEAELWAWAREVVLAEWIRQRPGTRPLAWWAHDAPEPRRRTGGTGDAACECTAYAELYLRGVPAFWLTEKVLGRLTKHPHNRVHDRPAIAVDASDPPTFESEREYLGRHGLLLAREVYPPNAPA
jgi:hypothetical protein